MGSMAVHSDGSYGQPKDVMFSFPCVCHDGEWEIVWGLPLDDETTQKLQLTAQELVEERSLALECLWWVSVWVISYFDTICW